MIEKAQLIEMFEGMRAQAPWDVDSDLLWGYFFTGEDQDAMRQLSEKLVSLNYDLVEIRPDKSESGFWLHVERVETHSPGEPSRTQSGVLSVSRRVFGQLRWNGRGAGHRVRP